MTARYTRSSITLLLLIIPMIMAGDKGIIMVPIADLLGEPIKRIAPQLEYDLLPLCGATPNASKTCPRLHQALFNEVVTIVKETETEFCIDVPSLFYVTHQTKTPQTLYWTKKSNLIPLKKLGRSKEVTAAIPEPLSYLMGTTPPHQLIVTLRLPWCDTQTGMQFSAGTRFVCLQNDPTSETVLITYINPQTKNVIRAELPKIVGLIWHDTDYAHRRKEFISLLKSWAKPDQGYIPYVWGGSSYSGVSRAKKIDEIPVTGGSYFSLADYQQSPKAGFDCSGLITRAAHIVGLPYFYKNTYTLAHYLKPIQVGEMVQEGDLIWIPSHVMIISDVKKHMFIEARSYQSGFGRIHELPLHKQFKGIRTYHDLMHAFHHNKPIKRIDKNGKVVETVKTFKILRLSSAWE